MEKKMIHEVVGWVRMESDVFREGPRTYGNSCKEAGK